MTTLTHEQLNLLLVKEKEKNLKDLKDGKRLNQILISKVDKYLKTKEVTKTSELSVNELEVLLKEIGILKEYNYPTFKRYGGDEGKKCFDFAVIKHFRDYENQGLKLRIDMTNDGFATKKTIMLELHECVELVTFLFNRNDNIIFERNAKSIVFQNQNTNYFAKYNERGKNYYCNISKADGVRLLSMLIGLITNQYKNENHIDISQESLIELIKETYAQKEVSFAQPNQVPQLEQSGAKEKNTDGQTNSDASENKYLCAGCKKIDLSMPEWEKVKNFCENEKGLKKFGGKYYCPQCQKKI